MKRVLLGMTILLTMALGFAGSASAVEIDLTDGRSLSWIFGQGGVDGAQLTGATVAALGGTTYEVLLFSAYSAATNTQVYAGNTLLGTFNNVMDGNIGTSYGEYVLEDIKILSQTTMYNYADALNYGNTTALQAYMLAAEVTINGVVYGAGSIFIGFEDGSDYDYNDVVLAFRAAPAVPVPAAAWLLGTGLAGLMALRRKSA